MSPRTPTPPSNEGKAIAKQFGRFMVVGGANTGVDLAILNLELGVSVVDLLL